MSSLCMRTATLKQQRRQMGPPSSRGSSLGFVQQREIRSMETISMCASRPFPDLCKSRDQWKAGGTGDRSAEKRANATVFTLIIYTLCRLQIIYNREPDA